MAKLRASVQSLVERLVAVDLPGIESEVAQQLVQLDKWESILSSGQEHPEDLSMLVTYFEQDFPILEKRCIAHALFGEAYIFQKLAYMVDPSTTNPDDPRFEADFGRYALTSVTPGLEAIRRFSFQSIRDTLLRTV